LKPLENNNSTEPANAINIPTTLCDCILLLNNIAPVTIVKIGVRAFKAPASELSISSSAIQNKKDGSKLPNTPDKKINPILLRGILRICFTVTGSNIIPAATILKDATWYAVNPSNPNLIRIKELPQIKDSKLNIPQSP
jgi:hypothetical protein